MGGRIVHDTGIPVASCEHAYEYRLPLTNVPAEANEEWSDWLVPYIGHSEDEIHELVRSRFLGVSEELSQLSNLVMVYVPFSILVYDGTPLLWMGNPKDSERDFLYLPPETDRQEVRAGLERFQLDSNELLVEFLALFGGMGERWPWEEIEFFGRKHRGKTVIDPSTEAIEAGFEYLSDSEIRQRRECHARWLGGIQLLGGGDGLIWHIGADGTICVHQCGDEGIWGQFDSLSDMIAAFLDDHPKETLFHRAYYPFGKT